MSQEVKNQDASNREVNLCREKPNICVPVMGRNMDELQESMNALQGKKYDIVELRLDYLDGLENELNDERRLATVNRVLECVRKTLPDDNLLFTLRTKAEGGLISISEEGYTKILQDAIELKMIDLVDIEFSKSQDCVRNMIEAAKINGVKSVLSSHNFTSTLPLKKLMDHLILMNEYGADVVKYASMPQDNEDVIIVMLATVGFKKMFPNQLVATMAMGKQGIASRLIGELTGSCLTFGAAKEVSAPGQINVQDIAYFIQAFHEWMK